MKKSFIVFLISCLMITMFVACKKDNEETDVVTYDPLAETTDSSDSDSWWNQFTTKPVGTTIKVTTTTKKSSKKTTTKKTSGTTTKKSGTTQSGNQATEYHKKDANTMTINNSSGGVTTLTKDPSNAYIKACISRIKTDLDETITAAQTMCLSDTSNPNYTYVFIYSSTSSKGEGTLKYVVEYYGSTSKPAAVTLTQDGKSTELIFFPYAASGDEAYTSYRKVFKEAFDQASGDETLFDERKAEYKSIQTQEVVKTFLSW